MAETTKKKSVFDILNGINVNDHTEQKKTNTGASLTYLSWAWAWAEVKKAYPDANYEIEKFNGIPYVYDQLTGFMVYTKVTIDGVTHEMWLPVMDGNNKAMKAEPYQYTTKSGTKTVAAATMFDVNKAIMRCLVKNLAMFGLGLYIYSGEDLPEEIIPQFTCAACGNTFNDAVTAEKSMARWGKHICLDCIKKKQAEVKRQKALAEAKNQTAEEDMVKKALQSEADQIPLPFEI